MANRRPVQLNSQARSWRADRSLSADDVTAIDRFHGQFDGTTELLCLKDTAKELGVGAVYIKDESTRFGLPSFKILGASWGTFRAIAKRLNLSLDVELAQMKEALAREPRPISLYAASEGNHGRAVARMASILGLPAEIHVPSCMHASTIKRLESEGAKVIVNAGTYDNAMDTAREATTASSGILVQDYSFDDYKEIPGVSPQLINPSTVSTPSYTYYVVS